MCGVRAGPRQCVLASARAKNQDVHAIAPSFDLSQTCLAAAPNQGRSPVLVRGGSGPRRRLSLDDQMVHTWRTSTAPRDASMTPFAVTPPSSKWVALLSHRAWLLQQASS